MTERERDGYRGGEGVGEEARDGETENKEKARAPR